MAKNSFLKLMQKGSSNVGSSMAPEGAEGSEGGPTAEDSAAKRTESDGSRRGNRNGGSSSGESGGAGEGKDARVSRFQMRRGRRGNLLLLHLEVVGFLGTLGSYFCPESPLTGFQAFYSCCPTPSLSL